MAEAAARYRALLEPIARAQGLDYNLEHVEPGTGREQSAFHFLTCGAHLLGLVTEADAFPSEDKRVAKKGAKWIRQGFDSPEAGQAASLLAQAMGTLLGEQAKLAGDEESCDVQFEIRDLVQEAYPVSKDIRGRLGFFAAEYRTLEAREIRDEIRSSEAGTGYHLALKEGREPDEDLVKTQQVYAGNHLRGHATLAAIEMVVGAKRYAEIEGKLLRPGDLRYAALVQNRGDGSWWLDVAHDWRSYVEIYPS